MMFVEHARQPGFEPGKKYRRPNEDESDKPVEVLAGDGPVLCCGLEPEVTYGLGAPCGGFSVWACCMDCGRYVWFVPEGEEE